jgi:hypothetical protein
MRKLVMNKYLYPLVALLFYSFSANSQEVSGFEYPLFISCVPTNEFSVDVLNGIHRTYEIKKHEFEYTANGKYRYPKKTENSWVVTFDSALNERKDLLTLYKDGIDFSIILYQDRYIMASKGHGGSSAIGACAMFVEGTCDIKWR